MGRVIYIFPLLMLFISCSDNSEMKLLKKENLRLSQQLSDMQNGKIPVKTKYILKLRLAQSNVSLSLKKHLKNYTNSIDFEIPVDKEYFDSLEKGSEIIDKFRFGSLILYGSFGDWEMTVRDKIIK
jgi:hypothetical protein